MKIFEFNSPEEMKDGAVAKRVDGEGNPVDEDGTPIVTVDSAVDQGKSFDGETEDAKYAREETKRIFEEETKMLEENHGLSFAIRPIKNFCIGRIEFPMEIIDEVNEHIDNKIIPHSKSFADGLVGQLKNDKKSAQLDFPLDDDIGQQLKTVFDQVGTTYLKQGYERDATAECFQCWTNHAYAGDYNPYHDHGTQSLAGLSGFLWLKVPECISELNEVPESLNNASGSIDGFTHLVWGTNSRRDVLQLKCQTEDYVKPVVGVMLVFPCWLKHAVLPFFGEGERRSMAMNWNVKDSEQELLKHLSDRELENYNKLKAEKADES